MAKDTNEATASLDKDTGEEVKPLNLDQLITAAVGGDEEAPPAEDSQESEDEPGPTQTPEESDDQEPVLSQNDDEAEPEGEPEEKSDGTPDWFNRRIGKEVRKRKEAEEALQERAQELEDIQKEIDSLRLQSAKAAAPDAGENPYSKTDSIEKLNNERQLNLQRLDLVDSVEELLDDGNIDAALTALEKNGAEMEVDREEYGWEESAQVEAKKTLKRVRSHARKSLDKWIPQQAQFISYKDEAGKVARDRYKWLGNPDAPEMEMFNQALENVPLFKQFPDYELQIARYVQGMMSEQKEYGEPGKKAPAKRAARKQPPTAEPKPSLAPAANDDDKSSRYRAARDRVMERADADSLDDYIGSLLENQ